MIADVLPHDLSGWITLAIALLSAFLGWMNQRAQSSQQRQNSSSTTDVNRR